MRASPLAHTSRSRRDHTQHDRPRRAAPPHLASPPPSPLSAALLLCDDASSAAMLPSSAASSTLRSALNRARRPNQCCFVATIAVVLLLCTILLSRSGPGNGAAVGVGERLGAFRGLQLQTAPGGGDSGEGAAAAALLLLKRQSDELDQLRRKVAQLEDKRGSAPAAAAAAASATCGPEQVDTIAYMAEHGVLTNSVAQRIKPVPFTSVQFLDKFVSSGNLTAGMDNTLIVGIVNLGYLDFALNWICFAQRQNLRNYLLGAVDEASETKLRALGYGAHVISLATLLNDPKLAACGGPETHGYMTDCFVVQTRAKSQFVITALMAGYNVVLSDMDITLIHNPFLYMPMTHSWEMTLEVPGENDPNGKQWWCTGWYFNKANLFTLRLHTEMLLLLARPGYSLDDQHAYAELIQSYRALMPEITIREFFGFDRVLFPVGRFRYGKKDAVLHHNNWLGSAKEKRARRDQFGFDVYMAAATDAALAGQPVPQLPAPHTVETKGAPAGSKLVCRVCSVCLDMKPAAPPIRDTFPGPITQQSDSAYGTSNLNLGLGR